MSNPLAAAFPMKRNPLNMPGGAVNEEAARADR